MTDHRQAREAAALVGLLRTTNHREKSSLLSALVRHSRTKERTAHYADCNHERAHVLILDVPHVVIQNAVEDRGDIPVSVKNKNTDTDPSAQTICHLSI